MAGTASQDQQVPDHMMVGNFLAGVEDYADRIRQTTQNDPDDPRQWNVQVDLVRGDDAEPTHRNIGGHREDGEPVCKPQLEEDAGDGEAPDRREERPAPVSPQVDQQKGCVRSGDQQIDGAVVEDVQDAFGARRRDSVIERGGGIEADERGSIDGAAENLPDAAVHDSEDQKNDEAENATCQPEAVR